MSDDVRNRSGVGSYYQDLVEHLRGRLAHVELFCPSMSDGNPYQTFHLPLPSDPTRKLFFPNCQKIYEKLRQINPHVIAVATPGPFGVYGLILSKWGRVRLCYGYHVQYNKLVELYWNRLVGRVSSTFMSWIDKRFFQASAMVVANSAYMVESARKAGAQKVCLVGTPIAKHFMKTPTTSSSPKVETVIYAGRLTTEKNIEATLKVMEHLPHLKFIIAGDGPLKNVVKEYSTNYHNLEYLGWLSRENLISAIDRSDLLILPSRRDSFGTIALEAMARKKLVLVSNQCGIASWPSLTKGIFLIENGESLTEAILRVTRLSIQKRESSADMARKIAQTLNAQTINQWLNIFYEIVHHPLPE